MSVINSITLTALMFLAIVLMSLGIIFLLEITHNPSGPIACFWEDPPTYELAPREEP